MHRVFKLSFLPHRAFFLLIPAAIALLAACTPDNAQSTFGTAGPIAEDQANLFKFIFWIAAIVFVFVEIAVVYVSIRFRRKSDNDKLPYQLHGNTRLEITWTFLPVVILAIIAVPTLISIWDQQHDVPKDQGDVLAVNAIGHQWWFEFRYPDHEVVTANELHIPVGRPIAFKLDSQDVIHSFWVPKIAGKVDMVPLNDNYMWFIANEPGVFYGQCAEFCGLAHAMMRFRVIAHEEADFLAWIDGMHTASDAPAAGSDEESGKNLFAANCSSCHTVDSTTPGSYSREVSAQEARWNGWLSDIENAPIVSAPNLTHFGERLTIGAGLKELNQENLEDWIDDPSTLKFGTRMQKHAAVYQTADGTANLSAQEVSDIATYLLSLKPGSGENTSAPQAGGEDVDGEVVFTTNCASCHSTGTADIVGPGLGGIADRAASRVAGLDAATYIRQSIVNPGAYVVDGYPAVMPGWSQLGEAKIDALVDYLMTLK
ncbi:MAG: cytochrome c oxidase subunit II [Chloroflexota bacterium]